MNKPTLYDIIIASITLLILDGIWIGIIMRPKYQETVKHIQGDYIQLNIVGANLAYLVMITGLYYFVINRTENAYTAFKEGLMFGFSVYGTYDFTSVAIFKNYHFSTAFIDLAWGTFLCGLSSFVSVYARRFHETPIQKIQ